MVQTEKSDEVNIEMSALREIADEILITLQQIGSSHTIKNGNVSGIMEKSFDLRFTRFHQLYDRMLWVILTSPAEELAAFADLLFQNPYIDLPVPLQVSIFRIMGLEFSDDVERLRQAECGISMYCDPLEEKHATRCIRAKLNALAQRT